MSPATGDSEATHGSHIFPKLLLPSSFTALATLCVDFCSPSVLLREPKALAGQGHNTCILMSPCLQLCPAGGLSLVFVKGMRGWWRTPFCWRRKLRDIQAPTVRASSSSFIVDYPEIIHSLMTERTLTLHSKYWLKTYVAKNFKRVCVWKHGWRALWNSIKMLWIFEGS